jgi:NitT/TauT family transport system substrate-binding protein
MPDDQLQIVGSFGGGQQPWREARETMHGRKRITRFMPVCLSAIALSTAVVACGDSEGGSAASTDDGLKRVTVMLPFNAGIGFTGMLVAQELYYADEGLEVEPVATEGSSLVTQQLVAGKEKFGVITASDLMVARSKQRDLKSVFTISFDAFSFAVPDNSDVRAITDLTGKKLGITNVAGGETALVNASLEEAGMESGKDVDLLPIGDGGPTSYKALKDGTVAAFAGSYNDMAALETEGLTFTTFLPETFRDLPTDILVASGAALGNADDRETAIGLARGWLKGTLFAQENPEAALEIVCKRVPEECRDMEGARNYMKRVLESIEPRGELGAQDPDRWEVVESSLAGDLDREVDPADALVEGYEDEIADFDPEAIKSEARAAK